MPDEPSWHWRAPVDASGQAEQTHCCRYCPLDVTIRLTPVGLSYVGFCSAPGYGGGYSMGAQTFAEFLDGEPSVPLPPELAEEIRGYLVEHQGATAVLDLVGLVAEPGRRLVRVDAEIDGVWVTATRPLPRHDDGGEVSFFTGTVPAGDHRVGAAFITEGAAPNVSQSPEVAVSLGAGARVRIVFTVVGRAASAAVTVQERTGPPRC